MIKKLLLGAIAIGSLMTSCSNDIDLVDTKKEIPVVYGLLSRSDTAHYVRIERAFGDNDISAINLARNIDSLYYKDITVQLIRVKNNQAYTLTKVDGNKEGYQRDAGIFADSPNYLYKIKAKDIILAENELYRLIVKRNDGAVITEAETTILPDMSIVENRTTITQFNEKKVNIATSVHVFWESSSVNKTKMYDISMLIRIQEVPKDGSPARKLDLQWDYAKGFVPSEEVKGIQLDYRYVGNGFYEFLAQSLANAQPAVRKIEYIQYKIRSGGQELYDYIDVGNVNLGITGTEVIPTYSNVKNGYGILSSRNLMISNKYQLTGPSLDSLINGKTTGRFGFVN
jgi:hypothetical protein